MNVSTPENENVCILIPTLNEESTIVEIIRGFKSEGFDNIFVIDGNSTDRTCELAEGEGASIVVQSGKGKGQAVQEAFNIIESEYVVMVDGDGTYLPSDIHAMLSPILNGEAEHVIGNRFANFEPDAFTRLNLIGNRALNKLFSYAYRKKLNDILSGYRAFTHEAIKTLELKETGFEIESEMTIESIKKEFIVVEVPITYLARHEDADTKLNPLKDGFRIGMTIYKLAKMHNPMFYFGAIGAVLIILGTLSGIFVVIEWIKGITHLPLTILTALLIISGIQMFIFGLMSDLVVSLHRETIRNLRSINKK
ncbi:glycosyl transferase family 2 [Methanohalobium evestigatum Z-7303]|uniref:Glycosyl transferase family 2 n=1 Tax=Methanohalobium evestigatum (strain ATCC BAA-1072 / DSM 3721 / NBRC 107634 / OCM 161 / Z-7303) TaxID=644295 RepID=D7EAE9_METEZ|nr:S-layer glycoprotein N-glycosyltransferase AglJ [Methanohalobium evestigatum]ADI74948.1 glycosyl transferase family 2 [Methanohalobium evestigatum Z-7303]